MGFFDLIFIQGLEKIIALKPDLVLTFQEGDPSYVKSLKDSKVLFQYFRSRSLNDYVEFMPSLGEIFQKKEEAKKIVQSWKNQWKTIKKIKVKKDFLIQVDPYSIYHISQ